MAQITIYSDDEIVGILDSAVKSSGISKGGWIADAVRGRIQKEWPQSVRAVADAWPGFPTSQQIRKRNARDTPRERL